MGPPCCSLAAWLSDPDARARVVAAAHNVVEIWAERWIVRSRLSIPISYNCSCNNGRTMREPAFWWREVGLLAGMLAPLELIYGAIAARRMATKGVSAGLPVVCVGNFTLGGAGKTPTVIMLAKMLTDAGARPFCLTRGYGGAL